MVDTLMGSGKGGLPVDKADKDLKHMFLTFLVIVLTSTGKVSPLVSVSLSESYCSCSLSQAIYLDYKIFLIP